MRRTIRQGRPASWRSHRRWRNWAGPRIATSALTSGGVRAAPSAFAATLRNWLSSRPMSSWLLPVSSRGRCCKRLGSCRSCSCRSPNRSARVSSKPSPAREATLLVLCCMNTASAQNGLGLLKEIAPSLKRVAFLQSPGIAAGPGQFGAIQASAPSLGVEVRPITLGDAGEIERAITAFARSSNGGLIVAGGTASSARRDGIIKLSTRLRLPALYSDRVFATDGGLLAYGPDRIDQFRRAADYV